MQQLLETGRLAWRLMRDPRVAGWIRYGIPALMLIYLVSPADIIPDFFPVVGQLDDLGVILFGMNLMVRFAPQYIVEEHKHSLGYPVEGDVGSSSRTQPPGGSSPQPVRGNGANGAIEGEYRVVPTDAQQQESDF